MSALSLTAITWNHSRALPCLVATAQRWEETHPTVTINWRKRTLDDFGHADVACLADHFDLIVMDHPWTGFADRRDLFVNFREHLEPEFLSDLERHSTGASFSTYEWEGKLTALPIDAATPVASWRCDRMIAAGMSPPATWQGLIELATIGRVIMPGFAADVLLNLIMLIASSGGTVCESPEEWAQESFVLEALERFRELAVLLPEEVWQWNPIAVYEKLASECGGLEGAAYCPFAYGYHNYGRHGFADHLLEYGPPVDLSEERPMRPVLGGTGIAVSNRSGHPQAAIDYARYVADPLVQRTLYLHAGGQPADRRAWLDAEANRLSNNFFASTLPAMDRSIVRPRYDGFVDFQNQGGPPVVTYLRDGGNPRTVHEFLNSLYQSTRSS